MRLTSAQRPGLVWLISGLFLLLYSSLGLFGIAIPGVEDLVTFMQSASGIYLYGVAFIAILIEGLYIVGNFLPGTTLIFVLAVLSQTGGTISFLYTILAIFAGWFCAGLINIYITSTIIDRSKITNLTNPKIKDGLLVTWYPTFRANQEVAQMVAGFPARQVVFSSLRVKALACLGLGAGAYIIPSIIDIKNVSNDEGFFTVFTIAIICLIVGSYQLFIKTHLPNEQSISK